jgi:hypothetical protein
MEDTAQVQHEPCKQLSAAIVEDIAWLQGRRRLRAITRLQRERSGGHHIATARRMEGRDRHCDHSAHTHKYCRRGAGSSIFEKGKQTHSISNKTAAAATATAVPEAPTYTHIP